MLNSNRRNTPIRPILLIVSAISVAFVANHLHAEPPRQLQRVILVFKTHFDIGYTDLASNVIQRYRTTMIDQALEVCDRNRTLPANQQFVWTIPGWPMAQITADWPGQTDDRKRRIQQALKEGRFVVHGLPFTTHTELLEPEDLVRGLGFASRVSRTASIALPRDAKMTDVPCHSWIMPTLLKHAGIEFLHLGCNAASRSPQVPLLFWWQGPDGSRLLTMYVAQGYGTGLLPPDNWPHRTWLALIHTGDNHGPPKPEEVSRYLAELKTKCPDVQVQIGRLADFADALLAEDPQLPVVRGDMPDSWIHGPMCDPQGASLARTIRPAIGSTESLNTMLRLWGAEVDDVAPTIAAAYEQSLLYGEHTWGGALSWVARYDGSKAMSYGDEWRTLRKEGKYKRLETSWAEHTAYIQRARDLIKPALATQLDTLAHAVDHEGDRIVVYNPLPWARDGLVSIRWPNDKSGFRSKPAWLQAVGNDRLIPVTKSEATLEFVAHDVPSMGYRTFVPVKRDEQSVAPHYDSATHTIWSPHFRIQIDPQRGAIRSLVDTRTGRQWVDTAAPHALGQYLYERFDRDQVAGFVKAYVKINTAWALTELGKPDLPPAKDRPYQAITPTRFQVHYEQTQLGVSVVMESSPNNQLAHRTTTRITAYNDLPYVDIEVTLHDKPADSWPEAGWICLPLRATKPQFRLGRLGSIVDPTRDIVPGSNHHLLALNTGMAVTDQDGSSLGICGLDSPLVSLGQPGCWKYSAQSDYDSAHIFVNLFNNQWTTNFRLWNEGTWTSRVRLWAIGDKKPDADDGGNSGIARSMTVTALETRYPLLGAAANGTAGPLPTSAAGPGLARKGVLVTALGANPDGPGTILRLWDLAGNTGPCQLRLPESLRKLKVESVDLRGTISHTEFNRIKDGLQINVRPFTPISLQFGG